MNTLTPEGNKLIDDMITSHDDLIRAAERERCAKICETRAKVQDKLFGCGPYACDQLEIAAEEIRYPHG